VVLNVEMDHPDYFKDIEQIKASFRRYISIAAGGYAVVNGDDPLSLEVARGFDGKVITFGVREECDYPAGNVDLSDGYPEFDILARGKHLTRIKLGVTGDDNIMNALAAAAVADICGLSADSVKLGLESFRAASRRMESRGKIFGKAELFDDYAHHPTEIKATLKGVLKAAHGAVWCVYQPHTYTRTAELFDEFTRSFDGVNVIFSDIYAAREVNTTGISSKMLADKVLGSVYIESFEEIAAYLEEKVSDGDTVIVMGAGDIIKLSDMLVKR
jgi:UDP-N-acetylmuramate--alanine ligase